MKTRILLVFAGWLSIAGSGACADDGRVILFQDRFNAAPLNAPPTIPPWTFVNHDAHPDHSALVRRDVYDLFGQGPANQALILLDSSGLGGTLQVRAENVFSAEIVTVSFLVYEPNDPSFPGQLAVQLFAGDGSRTAANRAQVFRLQNGAIASTTATYGFDRASRLDLVVNNSNAPITYAGGQSLASGEADIWIDGRLEAAGFAGSRGSTGNGPVRSLDLSVFSDSNQRIFLDDVTVFEGAQVMASFERPPSRPVDLPLQLEAGKSLSELFGYTPDYTQNVPSFDRRNRAYIRSRTEDYDYTSFFHTWNGGGWQEHDFVGAIQAAYPNFESVYRGAGWIGSRVVFDNEDRAYTIVNIRLTTGAHRNLLLFSKDYGATWEVHPISNGGTVAMEHFVGHNELEGPPFLLLSRRSAGTHPDPWASYHEFYYLQPRIENGQLVMPSYTSTHINNDLISLGQHSGGASFSVTKNGKTHFVWIEVTDDNVPGTPTFAATYDHATRLIGPPVLIAYAPPKNNSHNRPGIVIDSEGYLHVVTGSHHGQNFYYTRSLEPHSVYAGWTEPSAVWPSGWRAVNGEDRGGQTYVALVCDPDDTLHLAFRHWRNFDEYFNRSGYSYYAGLAYQRKPKDGEWSEPLLLVTPERGDYAVYYHKLAIDRIGRVFLSFSYFDWELAAMMPEDEQYWQRMVILTDDAGDSWRLAETGDFDDTWTLTPYNEWRLRHFSKREIHRRNVAEMSASPAGDNVPNVLKFLLDLPARVSARQELPRPFLRDERLTLDFSVPEEIGEIDYRIEVSNDMTKWHHGPANVEVAETARTDGRIHLRARASAEHSGDDMVFLRLWAGP